jgi:hypothetical protein
MAIGKKTGGRTKGTPNKTTASVKQALSEAFEGMGGVDALLAWGSDNQTEFYKLWAKLLHVDVTTGGNPFSPTRIDIESANGSDSQD